MQWIEFDENNLFELQRKLNLSGNGTKDDPIIIESMEGLKELLRFKNIKSYIIVRNISLSELMIRHSANITVQNCVVYYFKIEYCHDLLVENSSIVHFNVEMSNGNIFRNNTLHKKSRFNTYTLRTRGVELDDLPESTYFLIGFLFGGILFLVGYGILSFQRSEQAFLSLYCAIFSLIISGISFVPFMKDRRKRAFIKKFPINIFKNNLKADLGDLDRKYSAIYDI